MSGVESSPGDDQKTTLLVAFACGLVAGAALGTLFAPAKGPDTRATMRRGAVTAARHTATVARHQRDRLHEFIRRHGVIGLLRHRPEEIIGPTSS